VPQPEPPAVCPLVTGGRLRRQRAGSVMSPLLADL
jgi:hypothetical protein